MVTAVHWSETQCAPLVVGLLASSCSRRSVCSARSDSTSTPIFLLSLLPLKTNQRMSHKPQSPSPPRTSSPGQHFCPPPHYIALIHSSITTKVCNFFFLFLGVPATNLLPGGVHTVCHLCVCVCVCFVEKEPVKLSWLLVSL